MSVIHKADLMLIMWLTGYAEYMDAVIIGAFCALAGVVITAFCILTEPDVIPLEELEGPIDE